MKRLFGIIAIFPLAALFVGCASQPYSVELHMPVNNSNHDKQVVIFLDGTQNDRNSRTNISALSEIIKHQDKDNLYMFYNEGVGTGGRVVGAGSGWGIDEDVATAYAFLSKYYSQPSKLYIFGFSRGAYTSRILAGMIYAIGIYDLNSFSQDDRIKIARDLYSAYKGKHKTVPDIQKAANTIVNTWKADLNNTAFSVVKNKYDNVQIDILGIWDTVEALGVVPTIEAIQTKVFGTKDPQNIINPNERYIDQICNIRHVYHALSLDDNRANVFTPIIMSSKYAASKCNGEQDASLAKVDEVWFTGAHADIGGGYTKDEYNQDDKKQVDKDVSLSGVSLNWMLAKIKKVASDLLPKYASVYANPLAYVHDAENGDAKYAREERDDILLKYIRLSRYEKLRIHRSVLQRLARTTEERKHMGYDSKWYEQVEFKDCFDHDEAGSYTYKQCTAIEVVNE